MEVITVPEPLFVYGESDGSLFRIAAYCIQDGEIHALLDNGRMIKNFNKGTRPDWVFTGRRCPAWIWDAAVRFAKSQKSVPFFWKARMYGIVREETEDEDRPDTPSPDRKLEGVLTPRTVALLRPLGITTTGELLRFGGNFSRHRSICESRGTVTELAGFLAAFGIKVIVENK